MTRLWDWLGPEEREEVLAILRKEHASAVTWSKGTELIEEMEASKRVPAGSNTFGSPRWHRLRATWIEAAIEALGGAAEEPKP